MNNYIQIYNNVVSDDYCDELREKFDSFPFNQDVEQGPMSWLNGKESNFSLSSSQ